MLETGTLILVFETTSYGGYGKKQYNSIIGIERPIAQGVASELGVNFDYYNIGYYETNIIYLNNDISAVIFDYVIEGLSDDAKAEGFNDWIGSGLMNLESCINLLDYIQL